MIRKRMLVVLAWLMLGVLAQSPVWALDQAARPSALPPGHPAFGPQSGMEGRAGGAATTSRPNEAQITPEIVRQDRTVFEREIDLEGLHFLAVQHNDQIKIMESWARQNLATMTHRQKIKGLDPLYTVLDMAFRPEVWRGQNILYVRDVPLRRELAQLEPDDVERQRIMTKATVSPDFLSRPEAIGVLDSAATDSILSRPANRLGEALGTFENLFETLQMIPPAPGGSRAMGPWHHAAELEGNIEGGAFHGHSQEHGAMGGGRPALPGYDKEAAGKVFLGMQELTLGWRFNDVRAANAGIKLLVETLPGMNPRVYPTSLARRMEWVYDRTFNGTIVALAYFLALTLFAVAAIGQVKAARPWGMAVFTLAVACHLLAMGTRWYLAGRIPIQNQFESVLGAALFGCLVGWALERWRKNGLFGMALSFVGFLAMTACFVFPFVMGTEMGANIGVVAGILDNNIWLYIHVNIVIWSYALIAASFVLGVVYLLALWGAAYLPADKSGRGQRGDSADGVLAAGYGYRLRGGVGGCELGPALGLGSQGNFRPGHMDGLPDHCAPAICDRPTARVLDGGALDCRLCGDDV